MSEGAEAGMGGWKCVVGVPTTKSEGRIYATLEQLREELRMLPGFRTELVVCAHGTAQDARTMAEVRRFGSDYPDVELTVLSLPEGGPNGALTAIVERARDAGADLVHFFADDVRFEPGSLELNLRALVATARYRPLPILVGSHVLAVPHSLTHFRRLEPSLVAAVQRWFWHHVFALPARPDVERPRFCSDRSLAMWVESVPVLPTDESLVGGAPFLSNYCAVECRQLFESEALLPLIRPERSIAYVEVASCLAEWRDQQLRECIGVLMADRCFAPHAAFLAEFFAWTFAPQPRFVRPPRGLAPAKLALRALRRALLRPLLRKAEQVVEHAWSDNHASPEAGAPASGVVAVGAGAGVAARPPLASMG